MLITDRSISKYTDSQLTKEFKEKAGNHNHYKYYSKHEYICSILNDQSIFLSDGSNWNDLIDSNRFFTGKRFAKSFSYLKYEVVSMWMLYGDQCRGSMIDFSQASIKSIIDYNLNRELQIGHFKDNQFAVDLKSKPIDLYMIDIGYYTLKDDVITNLYRSDSSYKTQIDLINAPFYSKAYEWKNEGECRLIASFGKKMPKGSFVRLEIPDYLIEGIMKKTYIGPSNVSSFFMKSSLDGKVRWKV